MKRKWRIANLPALPDCLTCDACSGPTTTKTAQRARWQDGWMHVGHTSETFEVDHNGDVDCVVDSTTRNVPRMYTGWVCQACAKHAGMMILTVKTENKIILPSYDPNPTVGTLRKIILP